LSRIGPVGRKERALALKKIVRNFPVRPWSGRRHPFRTLIATILSQNTSDRNRDVAMARLERRFKVDPHALAAADPKEMASCIRPAGLHITKAPRIIEISRIIRDDRGGVQAILRLPTAKARSVLERLPGVGPKSTDVMLAFCAGRSVIPIDTHIGRVARRLGIADPNAPYAQVRSSLESLIPPKQRLRAHLSLIRFGREVCKARFPLCFKCIVFDCCVDPIKYERAKVKVTSK